ncbi:hypothetical protein [Ornithinibacillus contaminans]|nr:hypothetical protein [Ornithinibacillus contaminans]
MYYSKVNWKEIKNEFLRGDNKKEQEQFMKQIAMIVNKSVSSQQKEEN